ncbi:hypothetical protein H9P43_005996 [Blastocladiella emersonii ATCC 22665]|nr:hypothetical protein H9P43_005996 [Blastocladiella emersonii ATCC 22665]
MPGHSRPGLDFLAPRVPGFAHLQDYQYRQYHQYQLLQDPPHLLATSFLGQYLYSYQEQIGGSPTAALVPFLESASPAGRRYRSISSHALASQARWQDGRHHRSRYYYYDQFPIPIPRASQRHQQRRHVPRFARSPIASSHPILSRVPPSSRQITQLDSIAPPPRSFSTSARARDDDLEGSQPEFSSSFSSPQLYAVQPVTVSYDVPTSAVAR